MSQANEINYPDGRKDVHVQADTFKINKEDDQVTAMSKKAAREALDAFASRYVTAILIHRITAESTSHVVQRRHVRAWTEVARKRYEDDQKTKTLAVDFVVVEVGKDDGSVRVSTLDFIDSQKLPEYDPR